MLYKLKETLIELLIIFLIIPKCLPISEHNNFLTSTVSPFSNKQTYLRAKAENKAVPNLQHLERLFSTESNNEDSKNGGREENEKMNGEYLKGV